MTAVDTNVLIYVHDPRDPVKQSTAASLVKSLADGVLIWQVACEFLSASKKLEPLGYSRVQAWQDVRDLRLLWTTVLPQWDVLDGAEALMTKYSLSYWDALLVAACTEAGIQRLYTEDFDGYSSIDGVEIVNPFKASSP